MADPAAALQTALILKYRGDATLQGLMTGGVNPEWNIFDQGGGGVTVPSFPYVYVHTIMAGLGTAFAMGTDSMDVSVLVSTFTKFNGFEQARAIAARLYALTHGPIAGAFSISGFTNVSTLFQNRVEMEQVTDGLIQHIADRYKFIISG